MAISNTFATRGCNILRNRLPFYRGCLCPLVGRRWHFHGKDRKLHVKRHTLMMKLISVLDVAWWVRAKVKHLSAELHLRASQHDLDANYCHPQKVRIPVARWPTVTSTFFYHLFALITWQDECTNRSLLTECIDLRFSSGFDSTFVRTITFNVHQIWIEFLCDFVFFKMTWMVC